MASPHRLAKSKDFLLLRVGGRFALFQLLRLALADAAKRAGCTDSKPISPHRLRHTWATELLNCGIGLPALMKLMGHKSIQMTLRYLKVAQPDLQREFYRARQNSTQSYSLPSLSVSTATPDLPGIHQALAATRHLLGFTNSTGGMAKEPSATVAATGRDVGSGGSSWRGDTVCIARLARCPLTMSTCASG